MLVTTNKDGSPCCGKVKILSKDLSILDHTIQKYHDNGYIHKRGYSLKDCTKEAVGIHLIEETTEYIGACIAHEFSKEKDRNKGGYKHQLEEAADTLLTYLHNNYINGLPLTAIIEQAEKTLGTAFSPPKESNEK